VRRGDLGADPKKILGRLRALEAEIAKDLAELEGML
jgi:hypothetical protein